MRLACSSQSYEDALDGGLSLTEWLRFVLQLNTGQAELCGGKPQPLC